MFTVHHALSSCAAWNQAELYHNIYPFSCTDDHSMCIVIEFHGGFRLAPGTTLQGFVLCNDLSRHLGGRQRDLRLFKYLIYTVEKA